MADPGVATATPTAHRLESSSRSSSTDSLDSDIVGRIEPTTFASSIIFNPTPPAPATSPTLETPPDSRPTSPHDFDPVFDDDRLPAEPDAHQRCRRASSPAPQHTAFLHPRTKSIATDGLVVSLEKIAPAGGERRYVLKIDDEIRELLAAGARERERLKYGSRGKARPRRGRWGDLVFTQRFTTFDRGNPEGQESPYHGFFVLMWMGVVLLMTKTAAENYRAKGRVFDVDILSIMFRPIHLFDCLLTDAIMFFGSTLWNVPLQRAVMRGTLSWDRSGWILQALWQFAYLYAVVNYTLVREWPWIQTVFLVLHCIVMLMKQHSYSFYNGYLSEVWKRRRALQVKLEQMEDLGAPTVTATETLTVPADLRKRRSSVGLLDISQLPDELSPKQATRFAALIRAEIESCDAELSLEAENSPRVTYPENLTYMNYLEYIHFPTVVYELTYPRARAIDWSYVAEKMAATFGVLGIMVVVSQHFIYPVVVFTHTLHALPLADRLAEFPWILLKLVFPFMFEYLCVWYLIWELILNLLAEITRFADRGFYADWWNSTTWEAFARDWNRPVHFFLLRHVYHSSISTFQISRNSATLFTFLISSIIHELVMWCIFGKLRGYLLLLQMFQLPLVSLSRTPWMRDRKLLGNVMFWLGIWCGPSLLSSCYLVL